MTNKSANASVPCRRTPSLFPVDHSTQSTEPRPPLRTPQASTFLDNLRQPIHRWFRYSAGYSAAWAVSQLRSYGVHRDSIVLDPFAGSGTTLLAADELGVRSIGLETQDFVYRVAQAKVDWCQDPQVLHQYGQEVLQFARANVGPTALPESHLLSRCYTDDAIGSLMALRRSIETVAAPSVAVQRLVWLVLTSILRVCSHAGTAPWQYVLPNRNKKRVLDPFIAFRSHLSGFCEDILIASHRGFVSRAEVRRHDARDAASLVDVFDRITHVVCSPPYPNNYDYADATRLEMTFWGEIERWSDLHAKVRRHLIRSCSQHTAADRLHLEDLLADDAVRPIRADLADVCAQLTHERTQHSGRKTYHTMVAAYFVDLAHALSALRTLCRDGSKLCFVIGDSAPYGCYVPVDLWLGTLAIAAGFRNWRFEKHRDRNIKWKNRKHQVPLKEGFLYIDG